MSESKRFSQASLGHGRTRTTSVLSEQAQQADEIQSQQRMKRGKTAGGAGKRFSATLDKRFSVDTGRSTTARESVTMEFSLDESPVKESFQPMACSDSESADSEAEHHGGSTDLDEAQHARHLQRRASGLSVVSR